MLVAASATAVCLLAFAAHRYVHVPQWYDWNPASPSPDEMMRAIIYSQYGNASELHLDMHHARRMVRENDVLIRIRALSINPCDFRFRRNPSPKFMIPLPKIPGEDVAGDVVQFWSNVGDKCFKSAIEWLPCFLLLGPLGVQLQTMSRLIHPWWLGLDLTWIMRMLRPCH